MDPPYTHPGMYQPQQLWSPEPYPLAPSYYSYPRATHSAGVEVSQAVHRRQSDNEELGEESEDGSDLYKYRVRIINPKAKKESFVIDWHGVTEKFETVIQLKQKLINTLSSHVPNYLLLTTSVLDTSMVDLRQKAG